ncbi:MAG: esterase [Rubrivivax sp.]
MSSSLRRPLAWLLAGLAVLLAACGGGTSQIQVFKPPRLTAFGDELSALTPDGRKYAVNDFGTDGTTLDCNLFPIWVQDVARGFNFAFPQCPLTGAETKALTRAVPGARVADVVRQVDAHVAAGGFQNEELVLILAGTWDVLDLYSQSPARPREDLINEARARGTRLAEQVNRMVGLGARVVVSTMPDLGLSPYGIAQGTEGARLLTDLSAALNGRIRATIVNDGRLVGLVLGDELVQTAARAPGYFGLNNASSAVCTAALPNCTTKTLVDGATASLYLWASDRWFGVGGHRQLAALALARATLNPF